VISKISDASKPSEQDLFNLQNQRDQVKEEAQMEPYIPNLRNPWDDEMQIQLEDPAPHQIFFYNQAIEELAEELGYESEDSELIPDGGRPRKYFFTWMTENGNLLYEAGVNGDGADVLYESVEDAEDGLQRLIDSNPEEEDRYRKSNLYKIKRMDKVMEGVEVMTEQSGLDSFAPDGGYRMPEEYDRSLSELAESADQIEW
jgi:hypothetical protein